MGLQDDDAFKKIEQLKEQLNRKIEQLKELSKRGTAS